MKFAKELDQDLVPEWRAKYLDYKAGKKKVKAIDRAIQKSGRDPYFPSLQRDLFDYGDRSASSRGPPSTRSADTKVRSASSPHKLDVPGRGGDNGTVARRSTPSQRNERQPLRTPGSRFSAAVGSYGSIIASPPQHAPTSDVASLKLPDPALDPKEDDIPTNEDRGHKNGPKTPSPVVSRRDNFPDPLMRTPTPSPCDRKPSITSDGTKEKQVQGDTGSEIDKRKDEFFAFLDQELQKIESFYQLKETEATQRLQTLRQQLHIMRDSRIQELLAARKTKGHKHNGGQQLPLNGVRLKDAIRRRNRVGKNSEALAQLGTPRYQAQTSGAQAQDVGAVVNKRDFERRPEPQSSEVPYRQAKRKLKYALQEFYRGLELLKSYAYLNRTAFRKINKKYDKVVHTRRPQRYMSDNVNKAWFVQSEVVENLISEVEDLYSRYFERGNRKIAVSQLRRTIKKSGDYSPNSFRCGLLIMAGILFGIQSLIYAAERYDNPDPTIRSKTSYLLQIYGGYFLIVFHFLLFCLDCMVWTRSKINYVFVFEFDNRNVLDWRQMSELPSLFLFLMGLFMWLNFLTINAMYIYWPVILIGVTLIIMFLPMKLLYHHARKWWAYSNWRLLLAGLYPVEFRDFFLGDMYCSQTYAMGNISMFFCLYARNWTDPPQCNSSHSRLFGFFQCLPGVFRAFQCLRRFADTKNIFPHLLNFGKYIFTILYYCTLSLWRIDEDTRYRAVFITFALLNAIYTSVWDLAMDWSLCNPYAKGRFLRDVLAFRRQWVYYIAMVIDVVIRFNWIFYAIFTHNIGHAKVLSFVVCFSEVCRRGLWSIFRVENEHCTNVLLFRASRDVPLPYDLPPSTTTTANEDGQPAESVQLQDQPAPPPDVEHGRPPTPPTTRQRRPSIIGGISRVGTILATAHTQDFQRKKQPSHMHASATADGHGHSPEESTDEEYEEESGENTPDKEKDLVEELPFVNSEARGSVEERPPTRS
ncbi:signal transduction protein Syg1 [Aspergillus sclerotialis]|uniref:Signal transduction protein Syg1 n=1 Tax=Aspergillus sclerotialis TaxID=2070753 RepID=A0A3A2Z406_9EURO|nr:signal transduction protein Syg1 [Aspergillus sclerotialis]